MSLNIVQQQKVEPKKPKDMKILFEDARINSLLDVAAKQFQTAVVQQRKIIQDLAAGIAKLDGIELWQVARVIVHGFRQHNLKIQKSYVYAVLPKEYVDAARSQAASEAQKELKEDNRDASTKSYVRGNFGSYLIDKVAEYGKSTLVRIVNCQYEEIIALKKEIEKLKH